MAPMTAIDQPTPMGKAANAGPPRRRGNDSTMEISAAAFESLLAATRTLAQATTLTQTRASPGQMFEPAVPDSRNARMAELRDENSSAPKTAAKQADGLPDAPARRPDPSEDPSGHMSREPGRSGRMGSTSPPSADRPQAPPASPQNASSGPPATPRPDVLTADRRTASAPQPPAPASASANGVVAAPHVAANPSTPTVARQVGELLAGPRIAGAVDGRGAAVSVPQTRANGPQPSPRSAEPPVKHEGAPQRPIETTEQPEEAPFARLIRSIRLHVGERTSSARLQLHPPQLGRMRVDIRLHGDRLAVDVRTETEAARDIVAQRAGALRTALQQHGIFVHRLDVFVQEPVGSSGNVARRLDTKPDASRDAEKPETNAAAERNERLAFARLDVHG